MNDKINEHICPAQKKKKKYDINSVQDIQKDQNKSDTMAGNR